ncbi:substrate-binding domain-containing protein [Paenibacillus sp. R14(2021)]|uniref:GntR family transcriptional regulator n=1 Tax=Paenibacillus sp. R14(2021) TaxID=2859228 RepID=UPI001C614928|nr:GntR family transcriptional regulator [Paenibacillus sp. R14(2021)]
MSAENKPLYVVIMEGLKEKISSGEYSPDQQLPTEVELAEQSGVSRITSKRALIELEREGLIYRIRGSGSYVKKQEGFPAEGPGPAAGLVNSNRIISMILPYMATSEVDSIKGASDYLDSKGYYLSIHDSNWSKDKEKDLLLRVPKNGPSGIILYPISTISNVDLIHAIHWNDYPIVTIDQYFDSLPITSVVSDNFEGGYMTANKLVELGHERIAFVSSISIEFRSSVRDRYQGYCKALKDHKIPIDPTIVLTDFYRDVKPANAKDFYRAMIAQLIQAGVTAIQTEHDHLAVDLLKNALEMGLRVPEQLSIVGFDDHMIARHVEVPLTTISQNYNEIGRMAAELIVRQIERTDTAHHHVKVPVGWVERDSTAAPSDILSIQGQIG